MGSDYGDPLWHDPEFSGPVRSRSCTDIVWLLVFLLFLGAWGFVGYHGITHGDVETLLAPMDMKGRRCGLDSTLQDKKYLVFFNITECLSPTTAISGCNTPQVCVKECPTTTIVFNSPGYTADNFATWKSRMVCTDEVDTVTMTHSQATQYIANKKCASYVLKSTPVLFRCIGDLSTMPCKDQANDAQDVEKKCVRYPKEVQEQLRAKATVLDSYVGWLAAKWVTFFTSGNERDAHILSSQIVQDLVQARWYMAGALVAVVVLCFLYILILRWVVTPVVWVSIVGLHALLAFSCYLCYKQYVFYRDNAAGLYSTTYSLHGYFQTMFSKHQTWLALLIILAIILVIMLLIVIFLRSRITIAIALIREGSKAVIDIKSTVVFPIFPWIIQCGVIAYGIIVAVYLLSIGKPAFKVVGLNGTCDCNGFYKDQDTCDPSVFLDKCHQTGTTNVACADAICHFSGLEGPHEVVYMHLANLLGFFWAMFFISGCADMILAGAFSTWYWTSDKRNVPFWTLTTSIYRTLCFHLGTVAFGALIIAIVRVIRVILEYIDHKLKKFDNPFTRCILCCCKCFFWCLENFIKFINKNAYIMCAVHGKNFCTSARDAFQLLMRNIVRVVVLDKVTDFIFFLSKLLLSIGVGFAVYYLLEWKLLYEVTKGQRLHYNEIPAVLLGVATYLISTIFFNVYAMAVDTLFLCFLEDCERNDGSADKKYLMSRDLMRILGKKNKTA